MKNAILIFGAGLNQVTLIKAANELGHSSVVLDPSQDPPGKSYADSFYCVNGNDYKITKKLALKHKVKGIVTSQMEKPLRLMSKLAEDMGFIFHAPEVVERSLDKWLMKQAFIAHNVPCAQGMIFKKDENITKDSINLLPYPLIMKPKDATSSQGVYKIVSINDIKKYITISRSFSKTGEIIIEEFLYGPELSVEAVTFKGKTTIVQFTEKFITPFPRTVEMGHLQPATLTDIQRRKVSEVVITAITAIGIDNSASHTEVKLTKEGPKIIEIGARLGGDFISSYLTLHSCGVNMDRAAIQVALGDKPDLIHKFSRYSFIKYIELEAGKRIVEVRDYSDILNEPGVLFANVFVKPGETIPKITDSAKRPACVLVQGNSREQVFEMTDRKAEMLKSKIILGGIL